MAVGDTTPPSTRVRAADSVSETDDVRHFDQLSHREQRRFLALLRPSGDPAAGVRLFDRGEVVVFTDYYRITRS